MPSALALIAPGVPASENPDAEAPPLRALVVRVDNDLFAGSDRGYSNGVRLEWLSHTVDDFQDARLPAGYRYLNRSLSWLQLRGYSEYNMALTLGHGIFTPGDWRRREPIENDRPYAGILAFGVNYNGRDGDVMRTTGLEFGIVGPSARAEELQRAVHRLLGSDTFRGWDNQLGDEPVARLYMQKLQRYRFAPAQAGDWQWDLILRGGASLGNLVTDANIGAEWRFGPRLPDNFGSAPLLPVAVNTAPGGGARFAQGLELHGFAAVNLRAVAYDITLDGNTWKDSHNVERRPLVGDLGIGVAGQYGVWKFAFARYLRSREFEREDTQPQLGSLTLWREL